MPEYDIGSLYRMITRAVESDYSLPIKVITYMYALDLIVSNSVATKVLVKSCREHLE